MGLCKKANKLLSFSNMAASIRIIIFCFVLLFSLNGFAQGETKPPNWAVKIEGTGLSNLYKVDEKLYRSEQPGRDEMKKLDQMGIHSVMNVRAACNDKREARNTSIKLYHIAIVARFINYDDIVLVLKQIQASEKPVLIHCKYGSDRTGCIVAAYRMAVNGWSKQEAINEFINGGFGFHKRSYPNMLKLLNSLDVDRLKNDIKIP